MPESRVDPMVARPGATSAAGGWAGTRWLAVRSAGRGALSTGWTSQTTCANSRRPHTRASSVGTGRRFLAQDSPKDVDHNPISPNAGARASRICENINSVIVTVEVVGDVAHRAAMLASLRGDPPARPSVNAKRDGANGRRVGRPRVHGTRHGDAFPPMIAPQQPRRTTEHRQIHQ